MDIIDPHDMQIMVRLTAMEYRRLYDLALNRGVPRATLARQLIIGGLAREGIRAAKTQAKRLRDRPLRPSKRQIAASIKAFRP